MKSGEKVWIVELSPYMNPEGIPNNCWALIMEKANPGYYWVIVGEIRFRISEAWLILEKDYENYVNRKTPLQLLGYLLTIVFVLIGLGFIIASQWG